MTRKIKCGKILVVVFLTILLWVWADLELDEQLIIPNAVISVAKSTDPALLVMLNDTEISVSMEEIVLKRSARKIADENRKLKKGKKLDFDFDAVLEKKDEPGTFKLELLPFLQKHKLIKDIGLKVESCRPERVNVTVERLVNKSLEVLCVDETMTPIKANVAPAKVDAFVREGSVRRAIVKLEQYEIDQAMSAPVFKRPYVELVPGQRRQVDETVKISTPPEKDQLEEYLLPGTLAIALSPNLIGKYNVEVKNLSDLISAIAIKATAEARQAYGNMRYQVILEIEDEDKNVTALQSRKVIYNFPEEYVRKGEIILNQTEAQARFNLTAISSAQIP